MATIEDFKSWYKRDLSRYGGWDRHVEVVEETESRLRVRIYTDVHSFSISAGNPEMRRYPVGDFPPSDAGASVQDIGPTEERMSDGYLGCIASCRKPRAGEDWHRGSDLHDGPLTEETWHRILADIVGYELVHIHRRNFGLGGRGIPDTTESEQPQPGIAA